MGKKLIVCWGVFFFLLSTLLAADTLVNAIIWEKQAFSIVANAPLIVSFNITNEGYYLLLPGGVLNIAHPERLTPVNDLLDSIEYDQKTLTPPLVEIKLKTKKKLQHTIYIEDDGRSFVLRLTDLAAPPQVTAPSVGHKLTRVEFVTENNKLKLRFYRGDNSYGEFKVYKFTKPSRLVLDFQPPITLGIANELPVGLGAVDRLRASQFTWEPLQVRVVLDLNDAYDDYIYDPQADYPLTVLARADAPPPVLPPVSANAASPLRNVRVAIIAGHGGSDPGAISRQGYKEKDITLEIAKRLQSALRAKGAVALLNREGDEGMSMDEQAQFANRNKADVLVSIHLNSFVNSATHGAES
ncbi:N-acetylmuramoyl-L-alanine amidase, partial [Candidatus Termititenax persephonae]